MRLCQSIHHAFLPVQGSAAALYDSIHGTVFQLQESCVIYPGHDYNGHARTTVAEERRYNPRLNKVR